MVTQTGVVAVGEKCTDCRCVLKAVPAGLIEGLKVWGKTEKKQDAEAYGSGVVIVTEMEKIWKLRFVSYMLHQELCVGQIYFE